MTTLAINVRFLRRLASASVTLLATLGVFAMTQFAAADDLAVQIDQTAPIKLDRAAAAIVVGNPSVADISAHNQNVFFVIGRTIGTTNVVALDSNAETIANVVIHVTPPGTKRVVLHRSVDRLSYNCAPQCEWTQIPSDAIEPYTNLDEENKRKLELAQKGKEASALGAR